MDDEEIEEAVNALVAAKKKNKKKKKSKVMRGKFQIMDRIPK